MCDLQLNTLNGDLDIFLEINDPVLLAYMGAREEIE